MADLSLSGASQLSFAVALEKAEKEDPATTALRRCYRSFSRLSVLNERLGLRAGYTKGGEGGMSRTNQVGGFVQDEQHGSSACLSSRFNVPCSICMCADIVFTAPAPHTNTVPALHHVKP